jgi:hypothetical protein
LTDTLTGAHAFGFTGGTTREVLDWGFLDIDVPLSDGRDNDELSRGHIIPSKVFRQGMRFQSVFFSNEDDLPVVFDTGATISVSPRERDFISWETRGFTNTKLNGITASTEVLGVEIVRWMICNYRGRKRFIETRAYYVPNTRIRLLSPQWYLHEQQAGTFLITPNDSIFNFSGKDKAKLTFRMWDDSGTKPDLPIDYLVLPLKAEECERDTAYLGLNVLDPGNENLTVCQRELMLWHFKLGHFHLEWVQKLFRV